MVNLMKVKMNIPKILDFWNYFIKNTEKCWDLSYLALLISAPVCLPSPAFQTNEYFAKLYWIMNSIKMSEIIQIQKLNGWWEEINFHFMKYFPIWNNITYGMSSFSAVHNTLPLTEGNETAVTCGYCDIYTEADLWRYLCDCDPLGAFSRQRWALVSNERGMSPASQIKHSNSWPENLQCWPQSDDDGCYQHLSAPGLLLLISEWPKLQLPRALQTAEITRTNTANEQTRGNLGQSFVIQRQD